MIVEPADITSADGRRPAVWPWLLLPLVALSLFLALQSVRKMTHEEPAPAAGDSVSADSSGSVAQAP